MSIDYIQRQPKYIEANMDLQEFSNLVERIQQQENQIQIKSANHENSPIQAIQEFRRHQYMSRKREYLCNPSIERNELVSQIDQRSHHFWIEQQGVIVGCLRATPYPFELMEGSPYFSKLAQARKRHIEFNRYIIATNTNQNTASQKMLSRAFLYACTQGYAGVVAICRTSQKRLFQRFQLKALHSTPEILMERQGAEYWMLAGQCNEVMSHALTKQRKNQETNTTVTPIAA